MRNRSGDAEVKKKSKTSKCRKHKSNKVISSANNSNDTCKVNKIISSSNNSHEVNADFNYLPQSEENQELFYSSFVHFSFFIISHFAKLRAWKFRLFEVRASRVH